MTTRPAKPPAKALEGIRVLDLSRILAGPWATQMLADFGAEVIKVERPGSGDDTRGWGPPYPTDANGQETADAAYFHAANRAKRSVAVDLTRPEGQALVRRLAARSDVLVENFKAGGLKPYGLDYESLRSENPGLVYCSITGFGQDGPYRDRPGYDFMIQAMGGLMSVTGEPDGTPMKVGVALADILTGLYAGNAIQAALLHRERAGEGQHIDLSLLDIQVATMANQAMNYLATGQSPRRLGNAHPNIVPYQAFATADGHIVLAVGNDGQFARFWELAGMAKLAQDPDFASNRARVDHRDRLIPVLEDKLSEHPSAWWLEQLSAHGIPCGPINSLEAVFADPQVRHRQLKRDLTHPAAGSVPTVANPVKFSATPIDYDEASPVLGQHTDEVLAEVLGLSKAEIQALRESGTIA